MMVEVTDQLLEDIDDAFTYLNLHTPVRECRDRLAAWLDEVHPVSYWRLSGEWKQPGESGYDPDVMEET